MSEKKLSDDEASDQNLNDDFDFGEGETETRMAEPAPGSGLNKKILGAMLLVVLGVLVIMGYKIFKPAASFKTPAAEKNTITSQTSPEKIPESVAAKTITPPPSTPIITHPQTVAPTPAPEQSMGDIAAAFSSSEPATPAAAAAPEKTTTHESSIQNLQQELFTPEKVPAANSTATTNTPQKTASPDTPTHQEVVQLSEGLNKLNHQIDYILNQIKYLDSYSREVSDNLNKLNDSISAMDSRLATLTNTTSTLSKDMGNVRSEVGQFKQVLKEDGLDMDISSSIQKKKASPKEGKISIEEPEYTVHAVIPGRAWLKSARGQIITVAEGDTIGNYGKILVIDAANGVVLTSSGIAFR